MSELQQIEITSDQRIETGATQFNDDWPGVFIRGDSALYFAHCIDIFIQNPDAPFMKEVLQGLSETLKSCHIENTKQKN